MKHSKRRYTDEYIINNQECSTIQYHSSQPAVYLSDIRLSNDSAMCKYNTTPHFLAVDSRLYTEFVTRIGIKNASKPSSHLALVDLSDESYYVMEGRFNKTNIGEKLFFV